MKLTPVQTEIVTQLQDLLKAARAGDILAFDASVEKAETFSYVVLGDAHGPERVHSAARLLTILMIASDQKDESDDMLDLPATEGGPDGNVRSN